MIKVLKAGFYSSIQDKGRVGFTSIGVPVSGVMDTYSSNIANSILNNSLEDAVLEITFGGTKLQFLFDTFICISGGDFSSKINGKLISNNYRIKVLKNDVLSFGKINFGVRSYLAIKGGFVTNQVLKSRSFYKNITESIVLKKNDLLPITAIKEDFESTNTSLKVLKSHFDSRVIECFKGPEFDLLNEKQQQLLLNSDFTISNDNNRIGSRDNEIPQNS
jgi:allophanate hydrolase subunit 2